MKKNIVIFLFFLLVSQAALAYQDPLEDALARKYIDRTCALRHPLESGSQKYDASGKVLAARPGDQAGEGPWTVYGRLSITRIKLEPGKLLVQGRRMGMEYDAQQKKLVPVPLNDPVEVEILLEQPLQTVEQAQALWGRIFALTKEDFLASLPELWHDYLAKSLDAYQDDGNAIEIKAPGQNAVAVDSKEPAGVYRLGTPGLKPPVLKSDADPAYTAAARTAKLAGNALLSVTVDETGKPSSVQVVRPLGLGLDESAAQVIKTWTFGPATYDGQPVKVVMNIELEFRLF